MSTPLIPSNGLLIVQDQPTGRFVAFSDERDGLLCLTAFKALAEAQAVIPEARFVPRLWDAPIINPAQLQRSLSMEWPTGEGVRSIEL